MRGFLCLQGRKRAERDRPIQARGLRRARALALLTLALPGSAYIYQGEELGLPEDTTMPAEFRQDPAFRRTDGREIGRDGCRVPLPWKSAPSLGFGPGAAVWLPQPENFAGYAVERQLGVPGSTLELYHALLQLRRTHGLGSGVVRWQASPDDVLVFDNRTVRVVVNLGPDDTDLPSGTLIAASLILPGGGRLPGDSAAWLAVP